MNATVEKLTAKSKEIRRDVLNMVSASNASHIGSIFSCVDILVTLYFQIMTTNPKKPQKKNRDIFILSKGHAGAGLYATLARRGFFSPARLKDFCTDGSTLAGHAMIESIPGIEATTGSLGHGLPIGIGYALAAKRDNSMQKVYVILSDGELDEGSNWEAMLFAAHHHLDNLIAIVDYNKFQSFGRVKDIMNLEPLSKKWQAFNWSVKEVDGHDFKKLQKAFKNIPLVKGKPSCIIAHTTKGKGVSFMENKLEWHYKSPNEMELQQAKKELK